MRDRRKEGEKEMVKTEQENEEKREVHRELNVLEEKAKTPRDGKIIKLCVCVCPVCDAGMDLFHVHRFGEEKRARRR